MNRWMNACLCAGIGLVGLLLCEADAAPARAIYYTQDQSIYKADADGSNRTVLFADVLAPQRFFEALRVDSENGYLYWTDVHGKIGRGRLDGTGVEELHPSASHMKDIVVSAEQDTIFFSRNTRGIYQLQISTGAVTPIFEAPAGNPHAVFLPDLYYDEESSTLYWIESAWGSYKRWHADTGVEDMGNLPAREELGDNGPFGTGIDFGGDFPMAYCWANGQLVIDDLLDGPAVRQTVPIPTFTSDPHIEIDPDGGQIFYSSRIVENGIRGAVLVSAMDGSGLTTLFTTGGVNPQIAIDTADLGDHTPPSISIFSPFGGTTNNQLLSIIGSISDESPLTSIRWFHDEIEQGEVEAFGGDFTVPSVSLHPGDNTLRIDATDLAGNTGTAQVTVNWQPVRSVVTSSDPWVLEGHRSRVNVVMDSPGDVAGMTFVLHYDPERFEAAKVTFGALSPGALPVANTQTPGEVTVTFASPIATIPAGPQTLATIDLRARSVAGGPGGAVTESSYSISVPDMASLSGDPILVGTYTAGSPIAVAPRPYLGDINSNNRLDTGDASRMQSMISGLAEKRAWDDLVNDLNGSTTLDSGDVIRTLRAVVGLDPQPVPPGARRRSAGARAVAGASTSLTLSASHAAAGEEITLSVAVEGNSAPFSGASFLLEYPSDALRLENAGSHTPGSVVGGDAFLLWNLAPSQNDYANQSGSIRFGASSSADWPGSSTGGTLATFRFTVQAGADSQPTWPITVTNLELATDSGFDIVTAAPASAHFIGAPETFASWAALHFDAAELSDPSVSGWGADPDQDGVDNGAEYFFGTDPRSALSASTMSVDEISNGDGSHCLQIRFQRSATAIGAAAVLETSTDLSQWAAVLDPDAEAALDRTGATQDITLELAIPAGDDAMFLRLDIRPEP